MEIESRRVGDDIEDLCGFREVLILKGFNKFSDLLEVVVVNKWAELDDSLEGSLNKRFRDLWVFILGGLDVVKGY